MIKIGKTAPSFQCDAVVQGVIKPVTLESFADQYKLIFFYPLDFTFVCPTELHGLQACKSEFDARGVTILGVSVDSVHSHLAWLHTPKSQGGIAGVTFPLLSDINKKISADYGVLDEHVGIAFRGVFLLDRANHVQYMSINNLALGRNTQELLRIVDSLKYVEQHGEVCPLNWTPGRGALKPTREGVVDYFQKEI